MLQMSVKEKKRKFRFKESIARKINLNQSYYTDIFADRNG